LETWYVKETTKGCEALTMPASFQEIISSRLIKFVVGGEIDGRSSEFLVHEKAISQLSSPLSALVTQHSPEIRNSAVWNDVRKDTFERFVQFAYTGDYSIPKAEKRDRAGKKEQEQVNGTNHLHPVDDSNSNQKGHNFNGIDDDHVNNSRDKPLSEVQPHVEQRRQSEAEKVDEYQETPVTGSSPTNKKNRKKKSKAPVKPSPHETYPEVVPGVVKEQSDDPGFAVPEPTESDSEPEMASVTKSGTRSTEELLELFTTDFPALTYPLIHPRDNYSGTCEPSINFEENKSYSNIFLCHAALYVLGDIHVVTALKALALYKLHKTLSTFQLQNQNISDVTDLARYIYSKDRKSSEEAGGLRGLVCQYMAIHAMELSRDAKFMNLLAGGGQIVKDFVRFQLRKSVD